MANNLIQANTAGMKNLIGNESLMKRMQSMLGQNAGTFLASVLDLYTSDGYLNKCDPNAVMKEAMKAASLRLPITKALGFAYIVPYKDVPTFILGYRGMIQLAMRTGQYKTINADMVYEGEKIVVNRITGQISMEGAATSDKVVGYFAYFELTNGFSKAICWTVDQVRAYAAKKSKSYRNKGSAWDTDFDAMALKTLIRQLIGKWGIMSVEMMDAVAHDQDEAVETEVRANANAEPLMLADESPAVLAVEEKADQETVDPETGEILRDAVPVDMPEEADF